MTEHRREEEHKGSKTTMTMHLRRKANAPNGSGANNPLVLGRLDHILAHGSDCEGVHVAALTVHLDDSGTAPDQPFAVIAGWVAPVEKWERFTREWNKVRKEEGFEVFHMAEFIAGNPKSEFAAWDERKKFRVIRRLREIVYQRTSHGFSRAVNKKDYDDLVTGDLRTEAGEYHYSFAVRLMIGAVEAWRERQKIRQPIEYIFDRMADRKAKDEVNLVFEQTERQSDSLHRFGVYKGCHSFRDKADIPPLQAADILAWCMYQRAQNRASAKQTPLVGVETFNYFNRSSDWMDSAYQTREQLAAWVATNPKLAVEA